MKHLFQTLLIASAVGLGSLSASPMLAQDKMGGAPAPAGKMAPGKMAPGKMAPTKKKDNRASNVYVCKPCKTYYPAASAKMMSYKDAMGHKLAHADKAPVGYKDGSKMKMDKMPGKM